MGANLINTVAEVTAPHLEEATGWNACLRILSNLADRRTVTVRGSVPFEALAREGKSGEEVARRIMEASVFAERDPYRAATHNLSLIHI